MAIFHCYVSSPEGSSGCMSTCMLNPQLTEVVLRLTPSTRFTESAPQRGHKICPEGTGKNNRNGQGSNKKCGLNQQIAVYIGDMKVLTEMYWGLVSKSGMDP